MDKKLYDVFMRTLLSSALLVIVMMATGQTQQGVVKTRGRMVNGQYVKGSGLSGATIAVRGRSAVLSQGNGAFSFPVPAKTFLIDSVKKKGYQLLDADVTRKAYQYTSNTLYLVMQTPEQQMEDKLDAERKIRRTLRQQLQKREDELEELKAQNKLTLEEYQRKLQQLYDDQKNNEMLIADMAKEYAQIDYDQLDDLNRQISDAIMNGELTKADSLLRSKGDMRSRDAEISRRQQAEAQRKQEIAHEQEELATSEEGTRKLLEDFAADCYKYFAMFKLQNQHDSAAYYIELRANRDTTNAKWQFDAAKYSHEQNQFHKAAPYYERALNIYRRLAEANPQACEPYVGQTSYNLGYLYIQQEKYAEAILVLENALRIFRQIAQNNPAQQQWYENSLDYLSQLYPMVGNYESAYQINQEWLPILNRKYEEDSESFRDIYAKQIGSQSFNAILMKQYVEAERYARKGLVVDSTQHWIATNLAAALLFQGKYIEAETIYCQYKNELKDSFLDDFKQFAEAGVIPKEYEADVEKIKKMLNE